MLLMEDKCLGFSYITSNMLKLQFICIIANEKLHKTLSSCSQQIIKFILIEWNEQKKV